MEAEAFKVLINTWGPAGVCLAFCSWLVFYLVSKAIPDERNRSREDMAEQRKDYVASISKLTDAYTASTAALADLHLKDTASQRDMFRASLADLLSTGERRHSELRDDIKSLMRAMVRDKDEPGHKRPV